MKAIFAIALLLISSQVFADYCGGNCPSNDCPSCPCGSDSSDQDISDWCSQYSDWDQGCCQCIMNAESGGNGNAVNYNTDGSYDVGIFQINSGNWGACNGGNAPCNNNANLNCAIQVWQWGGNSFSLWATAAGCGCA